jgi:hypothetical protein
MCIRLPLTGSNIRCSTTFIVVGISVHNFLHTDRYITWVVGESGSAGPHRPSAPPPFAERPSSTWRLLLIISAPPQKNVCLRRSCGPCRSGALAGRVQGTRHLSNTLKFRGAACGTHPRVLRFHVPCFPPCGSAPAKGVSGSSYLPMNPHPHLQAMGLPASAAKTTSTFGNLCYCRCSAVATAAVARMLLLQGMQMAFVITLQEFTAKGQGTTRCVHSGRSVPRHGQCV